MNEHLACVGNSQPFAFYCNGHTYILIGGYAHNIQFAIDYYTGNVQYRTYNHNNSAFNGWKDL